MKKINILIISLFTLFPSLAFAQLSFDTILPSGDRTTWNWETLGQTIGNIVELLLILSAGVAIIYIIIGGYRYIFSFGNPEVIEQAKNTIVWAIIGLILALGSVLIMQYVVNFATGGTDQPQPLDIPELQTPKSFNPSSNGGQSAEPSSNDGGTQTDSDQTNQAPEN